MVSAAIDGKRSDLQNFNWIGFPVIFDRWKFFSNFKSFLILSDLHQNFFGFFFNGERSILNFEKFLIFLNLVYQILDRNGNTLEYNIEG